MKDINEFNERMNSNEEIIDNLVKKSTELEKQIAKAAEINMPDYSSILDTIMREIGELKSSNRQDQQLNLLNTIKTKLDNQPKATRQIRFLLFPETNQGLYYKIVFGRLIPWGLAFLVATYIFITGYKAIEIYRYNDSLSQSIHYQRAWLYLEKHAKKKISNAMDEAYKKTDK